MAERRHHRDVPETGHPGETGHLSLPAERESFVGILTIDLFFPEAQSLKARRAHLRPLVDSLRARYNASVAETGGQEAWQRAGLTVAVAGSSECRVRETLEAVLRIARERPGIELLDYSVEMA